MRKELQCGKCELSMDAEGGLKCSVEGVYVSEHDNCRLGIDKLIKISEEINNEIQSRFADEIGG